MSLTLPRIEQDTSNSNLCGPVVEWLFVICVLQLTPRGIPLVKPFRDLLFIAIEQQQTEIAKKLVYLGCDCDRAEWVSLVQHTSPAYCGTLPCLVRDPLLSA